MPLGGLIVGGIGAIGAGAMGAVTSGNAQNQAQQAAIQAAQQYLSLTVPDPKEQELILKQYQQTGKMDPRLETAFQQSQTAMQNIKTDPALEEAQMSALSSLENTAHQGGHTLAQDAYLNKVQNQVNTQNAGREGAIEAQFGARGMGQPSGLMLSAAEQNNQAMTGKENEASLEAAAQAQQNALAAIQQEGQLSGQIRAQDFGQAAAVAQAKDQIGQFNTRMSQSAEDANVNAQNQAQGYNVQEGQRVADQNTGLSNSEQAYNKQLLQTQYQNQLQKAGGAAAGYAGEAGQYNNAAKSDATTWGNVGQGLAKTGAGVAQIYGNKASGSNNKADNWDAED